MANTKSQLRRKAANVSDWFAKKFGPKISDGGMNLLGIGEASNQLGFAPKTVPKLIKTGPVRGVRLGRECRAD